MDMRRAEQALAQVAHHRQQSIDAGTAPWSRREVGGICASLLALGLCTDAGMLWLWALLMAMSVGTSWARGVRLKATRASTGWQAALAATFLLAFAVHVLAQAPVRALDWPLPNTVGALGAALTVALVSRPVHARLAASLRP